MAKYDQKTIAYFKGKLLKERVAIQARLQKKGNPATIEEEVGETTILRYADVNDKKHLHDVEVALVRCEEGKYGICVNCRELILLARLEAIPTASRCVPCQKKHRGK